MGGSCPTTICKLEQFFNDLFTHSGHLLDHEFNLNSVALWVTNMAMDALCMKEVNLQNFVYVCHEVWTAIHTLLMLKKILNVLCANGETDIKWEHVLQVLDVAADDENYHSPALRASSGSRGKCGSNTLLCCRRQ